MPKKLRQQFRLSHFLAFTSNFIPMVNFLLDFMIKETTSIFANINVPYLEINIPTLSCIEFIFHNSHATFELAVCILYFLQRHRVLSIN